MFRHLFPVIRRESYATASLFEKFAGKPFLSVKSPLSTFSKKPAAISFHRKEIQKNAPSGTKRILKNEEIKFPSLRVVYKNDATGEEEWKIMPRADALAMAKLYELDLILGNLHPTIVVDEYSL